MGASSSEVFNPWDWHIKLEQILATSFDDDALRRASAAVGCDWDALSGATKQEKTRSLIHAAVRADRIGDLIGDAKRQQPTEPWDAIADGARRFPLVLPATPPSSPKPAPAQRAADASPPVETASPTPPATSSTTPLNSQPQWSRGEPSRGPSVLLGILGLIIILVVVGCVALNFLWGSLMAQIRAASPPEDRSGNAPPEIVTAMARAAATSIAVHGTPPPNRGVAAYPGATATRQPSDPLAGFAAVLTDTQGHQNRVAAGSLRWQSIDEILLDGDRQVPLRRVRSIAITSLEPTTELKITLDDGSTVTGRPSVGCGFSGETAIGPLQLPCGKLKSVEVTSAGGGVTPIATRVIKGAQAVITDAQGRQTTVRADTLNWSGIDEVWLDGGQTVRFDKLSAIDVTMNGSTAHLAMTLTNGDKVDDDIGGSCRFGAQSQLGAFDIACDRLKRIEIRDASPGAAPPPVAGRSLKGLTVVVIDTEGKETRGPAESLRWRGISEIWLDSGQTLTFDKVRTIEVSGDQSNALLKLTLVNGATLEDAMAGGCWFDVQAASSVSLRCDQIRRIDIQ